MLNQQLSVSEAAHQLLNDDYANWSYEGAHAIADYLDDLQEECGGDWSFDVVAVRCDYSELSAADLVDSYGYLHYRELPSDGSWSANCEEVMEELCELIRDQTHCLLELNNGNYIVGEF
jgi:hypothetical protein